MRLAATIVAGISGVASEDVAEVVEEADAALVGFLTEGEADPASAEAA